MICPCGSGKEYEGCCGPLHRNVKKAQTPGELMRSRYSAYARGKAAYLMQTVPERHRSVEDAAVIEEFINSAEWIKLEILDEEQGTDSGFVEFKAYYREGGTIGVQHEKSRFVLENGEWLYEDGELCSEKIGRNEPCPCGSGKKYKRCCG